MIIEDQDAGAGTVRLAIEPRRRQPADAAANHHQIVVLLYRQAGNVKRLPLAADLMSDLEGSGMTTPEAGQRRRVVACALGTQLGEGRQAGGDDQCRTAKEV